MTRLTMLQSASHCARQMCWSRYVSKAVTSSISSTPVTAIQSTTIRTPSEKRRFDRVNKHKKMKSNDTDKLHSHAQTSHLTLPILPKSLIPPKTPHKPRRNTKSLILHKSPACSHVQKENFVPMLMWLKVDYAPQKRHCSHEQVEDIKTQTRMRREAVTESQPTGQNNILANEYGGI
jgi:hypothetical protein